MRFLFAFFCLTLAAAGPRPAADPADGYTGLWAGEARLDSGQKYEVSISIRKASHGFSASYHATPKSGGAGGWIRGTAEAAKKPEGTYRIRLRLDAFRNFNMPATASVDKGGKLTINSVLFSGFGNLNARQDEIRFMYDSRMGSGSGVLTKKVPKKPGVSRKKKEADPPPVPSGPVTLEVSPAD
ncbi:MAG: hypothetical protein FD189_2122 [Elusimicrobia bacterium]|nr:MAG: hypothetical protein FD154_2205 [Elusimicrobiota bacterium]KAF0154055.1 MAG: hypothetical protein FD189_2122 [Elusimicrobiota bacterium]